jgi:hypothetical protein
LISQGIGVIQSPATFDQRGGFNQGYDDGYENQQ